MDTTCQINISIRDGTIFYNPMINGEINDGPAADSVPLQHGKGFADNSRALTYQLQIANKKFPEFEVQSLSEAFYFLRRTLHYLNPEQNSLNISIVLINLSLASQWRKCQT